MPENYDIRFRRAAEFERGRIYDLMNMPELAYQHFVKGNTLTEEMRPDGLQGAQQYITNLNNQEIRLIIPDI